MIDNEYWKDVIAKLLQKEKANWAAHAIASNIENLDEVVSVFGKEGLIKNCLLCYNVNFSAQPYLDEVLSKFSPKELLMVYKNLDRKPIEVAGALMWLLEEIDPEFKWVSNEG